MGGVFTTYLGSAMNRIATLSVFLRVCVATLTLIISAYTNIAAADQSPGERVCGGVAGIECPQGYRCEHPEPNFPDAQGVCKESNEPSPSPTLLSPPNTSTVAAVFTNEGLTLKITTRCESKVLLCPFEAEIEAPAALFKSIEGVEYTYVPDRRTSPAPVTNASTHFHFEGKQYLGEAVYAMVMLRAQGGAPAKNVLVTGHIPFVAEVSPSLPPGLRFEVKYVQEYLEGVSPTYYTFRIWLGGNKHALQQIRSVEYELPEAYFSTTRIKASSYNEYFIDGTAPADSKWDIVAVITWKDGTSSTYAIPFRPR